MKNKSIKRFNKIASILLVSIILALSLNIVGLQSSAATSEENYELIFEDDFNRSDRDIHGDNNWYSYWTGSPDNGASHKIVDNAFYVQDYSIGGYSFSERPSSEAQVNQRVSVDIKNLADMSNQATANVFLRYFHTTDNYVQISDCGYEAVITNEYIALMYYDNKWGKQSLQFGGEKVYYSHNYGHTYRLEFIAMGTNPTRLSATLYDVTDGNSAVVSVSGMDSTSYLQTAGTAALCVTRNGAGQDTAIYDNFKYEKCLLEDTVICKDDFDRTDGTVGNGWTAGSMADANIASNILKLKTVHPSGDTNDYIGETALLRPMSEASLNQTVSADFQSANGLWADQGGVIIARCQGETATTGNCYHLQAWLGFNGAGAWYTPVRLFNSQNEVIYQNDWVYVGSDQKYRLELSTVSISETETLIGMKFLCLDEYGNVTETKFVDSIVDDDPNLQKAGTAGISIYDKWGATLSVDNFSYTTPAEFDFSESGDILFETFEAEAEETYRHNYTTASETSTEASGMGAAIDAKNSVHMSYEELKTSLDINAGYIAFTLYAEESGDYQLKLRYRFGCDSQTDFDNYVVENGNPYAAVVVNGKSTYRFVNNAQYGEFGTTEEISVSLNNGINIIYCMSPTSEIADTVSGAYIDYDCLYGDIGLMTANCTFSLPGDVNTDNKIDLKDLIRYKKFLAYDDVPIDKLAADLVDTDTGEINLTDLAMFKKYLLSYGMDKEVFKDLSWLRFSRIINSEKTDIMENTYYKLCTEKELNIAYFGGSITYGTGSSNADKYSWRALTTDWFSRNFPNAKIKETNAAIGGTGTAFGIYRAVSDLKLESADEKPDLVFIEFAINDLYDGTDTATAKSNVEYIIRTIYGYAPDADILMVLTTDQACMNNDFDMLAAHRSVAQAYNIPYICVGKMLWNEMLNENNGQYPTAAIYGKYFSDTVHPANAGHAKYADYITTYISEIFFSKTELPAGSTNSFMPEKPINTLPDSPYAANLIGQIAVSGTNIDENGYLTSNTAGTTFSFTFKGTDLKIWHWGTAQGGNLTVSVDGGETKTVELYREFANHVICPIVERLDNTSHTVTVTLESSSYGSAMDIRYFLISGSNEHSGVTLNNGAD